jgi:hypothetical protein
VIRAVRPPNGGPPRPPGPNRAGHPKIIGAVNPALTVMANAIGVGEHLLQRMG